MIDIDLRHGGYTSIQEYEENRPDGPLPRTLPSSTGGGGRHLFYRYPDDGAPVPGRNPWLRGVDIKSDGGYVVLPGSKHSSGGTYAWADRSAPITKMPADVLQSIRLRSSDGVRDGPPDTDDILDGVPEGVASRSPSGTPSRMSSVSGGPSPTHRYFASGCSGARPPASL